MSVTARTVPPQSSTARPVTLFFTVALLCAVLLPGARDASAQAAIPIDATLPGEDALFSVDTPVGPLQYFAGRGMRFGRTGLHIGGFTTLEIDREDGDPLEIELDSINFLVLMQPIDRLRLFAEIEVGNLFATTSSNWDVDSDPDADFERLYAEWSQSDALNLRVGKFQTPVGRWNLVPAEPFTWTASEPVQVELAFDEHQTGVALFGSLYPGANQLRYWVYGQIVDPLDSDSDPDPADRSVGGRLEFGDELRGWSVGASVLATELKGDWSYLGGLDALLQVGPLELTTELVIAEGNIPGRDLWGVYLQGVYDLGTVHPALRNLYAVGRYERIDPNGSSEDAHILDLGLTWIPKPYLNIKAGYRTADRESDDVRRGITASLSVLF